MLVTKVSRMFIQTFPLPYRQILVGKHNLNHSETHRRFNSTQLFRIFGIETSCDDTGCAVVDSEGTLLGEALYNQMLFHVDNGGVIPPIAARMHRDNMPLIADQALDAAGMSMADIDAVAATVKPGMNLSLEVGAKYGCYLARQWQKPFIPIHHMEAHALTARMFDKDVHYPFLALLISGGHCLLVLVQNTDSFLLIGKTLDCSPGEVLDKACRRMKLRNIPALRKMCGGQAVETMASKASNPTEFGMAVPLIREPHCDFSFTGMKSLVDRLVSREEQKYGTEADSVIESASNLCAAIQLTMAHHFCQKVERAMAFLEAQQMIPDNKKALVVSGGVACNQFFAKVFKVVCDTHGYHLSIPPPKYCNDNGVMIAWNGVERFKENKGILHWDQLDSVEIQTRCPLGVDIRHEVAQSSSRLENSIKFKTILQLLEDH